VSAQRNERVDPWTSWPKRAFFSIVTICIYTVIVLALAELGLRALGFTPRRASDSRLAESMFIPDQEFGWINRPGTILSTEAGHVPMTFLADNTRRSWKTPAKADQRAQVLMVGCSFTQGMGVVDEDTFSYLLNARYPYLMFRNYGTGGYGTYQSLLRVKESLSQPDANRIPLVVYGFIDVHMQRNVAVPDVVRSLADRRNHYVIPPHVRLGKDGLQQYGLETIPFWPLESHSAIVTLLANAFLDFHLRKHGSQLGATTALIDQMNQLVVGQHKRFLIALLDRPPKGLVPFLEAQKIDYVNCDNPAFDKIPSDFRLGGFQHPNAKQHALWATCIGDWIDHEMPTLAKQ
jgi:hypothetical protein